MSAGIYQLGAGYSIPEGKKFYLVSLNGNVKQIRSVFNLGSGDKYLIEVFKGGNFYVTPEEFYFVPANHQLKKVD